MTYPRSHLIDPKGGTYHVCSRCVRRAFLCGNDPLTGVSFEHRRAWLEARVIFLADVFAIELYAYAVMSNHYHMVLKLKPYQIQHWSDEEVVDRWLTLSRNNKTTLAIQKAELLKQPDRLSTLRERLGSLSWLMRYINEPLARLANQEDHCQGRFWEERFKSQRLLDETAVLAGMVYVDLNPVRAGLCEVATEAEHTSLKHRIKEDVGGPIRTISKAPQPLPFTLSLADYIQLTQWTLASQQSIRSIKSKPRSRGLSDPQLWHEIYLPKPGYWQRAIGSIQSLKDYAKDIGQCWIRTNFPQRMNVVIQ